jgi:hypothetical protein
MTLYQLLLFTHVACATALFAALALEGFGQRRLAAAGTFEQAREWLPVFRLLPALGVPALFGALGTGIYLATVRHMWELPFAKIAVPALVLVAIAGAISGPRRGPLAKELAERAGPLPPDLSARLRHPIFAISWWWRSALLTLLLFAMTTKL